MMEAEVETAVNEGRESCLDPEALLRLTTRKREGNECDEYLQNEIPRNEVVQAQCFGQVFRQGKSHTT